MPERLGSRNSPADDCVLSCAGKPATFSLMTKAAATPGRLLEASVPWTTGCFGTSIVVSTERRASSICRCATPRWTKTCGWWFPAPARDAPWYLLTNEPIANVEDAWKVVFAYARRRQVELCYRACKTDLAMESPHLWFWENRLKLLLMVSLLYSFLLSLLDQRCLPLLNALLRNWCHRTSITTTVRQKGTLSTSS